MQTDIKIEVHVVQVGVSNQTMERGTAPRWHVDKWACPTRPNGEEPPPDGMWTNGRVQPDIMERGTIPRWHAAAWWSRQLVIDIKLAIQ